MGEKKTMRKLATIQKIHSLTPHPNANTLEIAKVLGWQCIVKKDEFNEGDLCVYCEVDSVFPDKPEFEFLRKNKFRLRTIRLRGEISQGLCLPLSMLPKQQIEEQAGSIAIGDGALVRYEPNYRIRECEEVTKQLGIVQYIPIVPACLAGEVKGPFPSFIPKTDETRIQILQDVLTRYKNLPCYVTEKLDGASITYYYRNGEFGCCSRNLELKESANNAIWQLAREMKIEEKLKSYGKNIAIQGELIGPGISDNSLKTPEKRVYFFNAFDIDKYKYYNYQEMINLFDVDLILPRVPAIQVGIVLHNNIDEWVKYSIDKSLLNNKVWREGIVVRPLQEVFDMQMSTTEYKATGRVSFKVLNPEYLLINDIAKS